MPARRAIIRWARRLFRREWRQQILVLALVTTTVAFSVGAAAAAYNVAPSPEEEFGSASHLLWVDGDDPEAMAAEVDAMEDWFGTTEAIRRWGASIPGSVDEIELRGQDPDGPFGAPMLALTDGRYPTAPDEVALTDVVASSMQVDIGDRLDLDGDNWGVVGTVENPKDLADEFALVSPTRDDPPDEVTVLVQTSDRHVLDRPETGSGAAQAIAERGTSERDTAAVVVYVVTAIVLLLVALVAGAGFMVMAQRRQRQIGLLAATGATDRHLRLVMLANGAAVGATAAVVGAGLGLLLWFAAAPHLEPAAAQRIDRLDVPWWVVAVGMVLALATATGASWWPARAVARLSITQAVSSRPAAPKPARRPTLLAGGLLAVGLAGIVWSNPDRPPVSTEPFRDLVTTVSVVLVALGVLFACPLAVRLLGRIATRLPVAGRLALRDLARYQARSGAALGAMSLALGIPVAVIGVSTVVDGRTEVGNLSDRQLMIRTGTSDGGVVPDLSVTEIELRERAVSRIAGQLDDPAVLTLDVALEPGTEPIPGFDALEAVTVGFPVDERTNRDVQTYVASTALLRHYGIDPESVDPGVDVLTARTEDLVIHTRARRTNPEPVTRLERLDVTGHSSLPTTLFTSEAVQRHGWETVRAGWLVEADGPLSAAQIGSAREIAAETGLSVEARNQYVTSSLTGGGVAAGMLVALAVVAMSVGLIRGEASGDLRTLTASGATSTIRRRLTAWTAGALGLLGVALGTFGAYLAMGAGYVRNLDDMASVPVAALATLAIGVPLLAAGAGWLLGGREPSSLLRPILPLSCVVLMAVVAAAGCGGGSGDDDDTASATDSRLRRPTPLQEWWASVGGFGEAAQERERRVEQGIAECMQAQGFEYTPREPHPGAALDVQGDVPWNLPADQFAERYGYGLFTIDHPAVVDPNAARLAAMSDEERAAFDGALVGAPLAGEPAEGEPAGSDEPADEEEGEPASDTGTEPCIDAAWAAELESSVFSSEAFAGLEEELNALFERTESDPRVEEVARDWADCMADIDPDYAEFETPDDALDSVLDRFDGSAGIASIDVNGIGAVHRLEGVDITALPPDELRDLRDYEVRVATDDQQCRAEYDRVRYDVTFELEEEFMEERGAELEQIADAYASAATED